MVQKSLLYIFLLLPLLILTGCGDATEPDTLGYVVAIGIDKPQSGDKGYDITLQFANPSKISGGSSEEGGKGGQDSIENVTVTAPGIYSAVNIANHIVSKQFILSHTKLIVFSEDLCRDGIKDFLETLGRSSDVRPNTYFAMSTGRAQEFLEAVNPETEVNPVRYYSMLFKNDFSGFIPKHMSQDFYFYYAGNEKCVVMPVCATSGADESKDYTNTGYQQNLEDLEAGEISTDKEETQVMGMAVFDGDKVIGKMGEIETEIYNIIIGQYNKGYVAYQYSKTPDRPITVIQRERRKPKIKVDTSGDVPKISIDLFIEADFVTSTPGVAVEDNLDDFADEASSALKKQIEQFLEKTRQIKADIVGFGSYAKRDFLTNSDFSDYNWKEKYPRSEFDVNVDFAVRRTGLIVRSEKR